MAKNSNKGPVNPVPEGILPDVGGNTPVINEAPVVTETPVVVETPVVNTPPVAESKPAKGEKVILPEGKVLVDEKTLNNILTKLEELQTNQKQFEDTASQDQVRKIEALRAAGKLVKSVKIRTFQGQEVVGWQSIQDEVYVADGRLIEKQTLKISFEAGEPKEISLADFNRNSAYISCEVISESKNREGELIYVVMRADGKELTINSKFVN